MATWRGDCGHVALSFLLVGFQMKSLGATLFGGDGRGAGEGASLASSAAGSPQRTSKSSSAHCGGYSLTAPHRAYLLKEPLWTWRQADFPPIPNPGCTAEERTVGVSGSPSSFQQRSLKPALGRGGHPLGNTSNSKATRSCQPGGATPILPGDSPVSSESPGAPLGLPLSALSPCVDRSPSLPTSICLFLSRPLSPSFSLSALSGPEAEVSSAAI